MGRLLLSPYITNSQPKLLLEHTDEELETGRAFFYPSLHCQELQFSAECHPLDVRILGPPIYGDPVEWCTKLFK